MQDEEYAVEDIKESVPVTTPEGLKRRRVRYYDDRTDCLGKCQKWILLLWNIIFMMENIIGIILIVGCAVVAQYASNKQGGVSAEESLLRGWVAGLGCFTILYILREITYKCADDKTTRRGIRDESNRCVQLVHFVTWMMLVILFLSLAIAMGALTM